MVVIITHLLESFDELTKFILEFLVWLNDYMYKLLIAKTEIELQMHYNALFSYHNRHE